MILRTLSLIALSFLFTSSLSPLYAQKYNDVDNYAQSIKYNGDIAELAKKLAEPYDADEFKARAIFAWLAYNINYDHNKRSEMSSSSRKNRIKAKSRAEFEEIRAKQIENQMIKAISKKKGVCEDFSYLFRAMAENAGLESAFVTGYSKNSPKTMSKRSSRGMHAWNAVKIDNNWQLLDVTWSTGISENENFGDGYFLIDPSIFGISHHPDSIDWQLLEQKISYEEFLEFPFMYPSFFNYPIQNFEPKRAKLQNTDQLIIDIALSKTQKLAIFKSQKPTRFTFDQNTDNQHVIDVSSLKTRGILEVVIIENGRVTPLLAFRR